MSSPNDWILGCCCPSLPIRFSIRKEFDKDIPLPFEGGDAEDVVD
jgi:hypothetical protein